MDRYNISGFPVVDGEGRLVGILTSRDMRFESNHARQVSEVMTREGLITAPAGTSLTDAERILHRARIEKLPVVDEEGRLRGLITFKDINKRRQFPNACKDDLGRLRVGAADRCRAQRHRPRPRARRCRCGRDRDRHRARPRRGGPAGGRENARGAARTRRSSPATSPPARVPSPWWSGVWTR